MRKQYGVDKYFSEKLINLESEIRKKIFNPEYFSLQYAGNIKTYYDKYYDNKPDSYIKFQKLIDNHTPFYAPCKKQNPYTQCVKGFCSGPTWARTRDHLIMSQVL